MYVANGFLFCRRQFISFYDLLFICAEKKRWPKWLDRLAGKKNMEEWNFWLVLSMSYTNARRMSVLCVDKIINKAAHSLRPTHDDGIRGDAIDVMTRRR